MPQATNLAFLQDLRGLMEASIENALRRYPEDSAKLLAAIRQWITIELSVSPWQIREKEDVVRLWADFQLVELRTIMTTATFHFITNVKIEYGEEAYDKLITEIAKSSSSMAFAPLDDAGKPIADGCLVDKNWVASMVVSPEDMEGMLQINPWLTFLIIKDMLGVNIVGLQAARKVVAETSKEKEKTS